MDRDEPGDPLFAAERVVAQCPQDGAARLHLAALLLHRQRWRDALAHISCALERPGAPPHGWILLSSALHELGRTSGALEAIHRAIALRPQDPAARMHLASLLTSGGRYDDALAELDEAASLIPDHPGILRVRSGVDAALGDLVAALAHARRAAMLDPANPEYREHLAHVERLTGTRDAAPPAASDVADRVGRWLEPPRRGGRPPAGPPAPWHRRAGAALARFARIILALMRRDMQTRYGRTRLGYVWALVEPISHLITLGSVFTWLNHSPPLLGNNLYLFYVSGLTPYLLFSHLSSEMMDALDAHNAVLQLPIVKRMDVVLARGLLTLASETTVGIIVFAGFALFGYQGYPADLLTCMQAVLAIWAFALGMGAVNLVIAAFFHTWQMFFNAVLRLMYFSSGIYYSPLIMPSWLREILVWNPLLQGIEWFRSGFYLQYDPHWLDRGYVTMVAACALMLGFSLIRVARRHLEVVA